MITGQLHPLLSVLHVSKQSQFKQHVIRRITVLKVTRRCAALCVDLCALSRIHARQLRLYSPTYFEQRDTLIKAAFISQYSLRLIPIGILTLSASRFQFPLHPPRCPQPPIPTYAAKFDSPTVPLYRKETNCLSAGRPRGEKRGDREKRRPSEWLTENWKEREGTKQRERGIRQAE